MLHPTLSLYRNILRHARIFPSIKRDKVVLEIMDSFRRNRNEQDPEKLRVHLLLGTQGLEQLKSYTCLKDKPGNLSVTMHQNPMPINAKPIKALKETDPLYPQSS